MGSFENDEVAINLALFKTSRIFHLFNPNSPKFLSYNVYRLACVSVMITVLLINAYGLLGFVIGTELKINMEPLVYIQTIGLNMLVFQSSFKAAILLFNANKIWELLDLTRINFFTSSECYKYNSTLYYYQKISNILTNFLIKYGTAVLSLWYIFPLIINTYMTSNETVNVRYENIFNFLYPITLSVYTRYYFLFLTMECIVSVFCGYITILTNIVSLSFFLVIIAQYEILFLAFESIGQKFRLQEGKEVQITQLHHDFISILKDQQRMYMKLRTFYTIVRPIIFSNVIINFCTLVILSVPMTEVLLNPLSKSMSIPATIKLVLSMLFIWFELYSYCYLLDDINTKKESVSFGMYCCNWTEMNLEFQKLLLLSMRMNDANKLKIKITHLKIINVIFFTKLMTTIYNIISVLLKILL